MTALAYDTDDTPSLATLASSAGSIVAVGSSLPDSMRTGEPVAFKLGADVAAQVPAVVEAIKDQVM